MNVGGGSRLSNARFVNALSRGTGLPLPAVLTTPLDQSWIKAGLCGASMVVGMLGLCCI